MKILLGLHIVMEDCYKLNNMDRTSGRLWVYKIIKKGKQKSVLLLLRLVETADCHQ